MHSKTTWCRWFLTSLWNVASPQFDKQTTKNEASNVLQTSELLSHFPSRIRFVFRSNSFPTNNSLMQKMQQCLRQLTDNDVTKQSLSSIFIPFIKLCGHFGNVLMKPSAVFIHVLLTFLHFYGPERKIFASFLLNILFNIKNGWRKGV